MQTASRTFKLKRIAILSFTLVILAGGPHAQGPVPATKVLAPTSHPRVPREMSQLWLVPENAGNPGSDERGLVRVVRAVADGEFASALDLVSGPPIEWGTLAHYAEYFGGLAQLGLGRADEACRTFQALQAEEVVGYLREAARLAEAECHEKLGDHAAALAIYEQLLASKPLAPDELLMRVGRAAKIAGDLDRATLAFARVYYEFPFSDFAAAARGELNSAGGMARDRLYRMQLDRAERLFEAKRYGEAHAEFLELRGAAPAGDGELIDLRLAESEYFLKRPRRAIERLRPYLSRASRRSEALYYHALAVRALGNRTAYRQTLRRLVAEFPSDGWAEEALNDLATYEIRQNDEYKKADEVFRELYTRFPTGRYAERAAWQIGWWAYRNGRYGETSRLFDGAALDFPRSDYRPAWLYWSGRAYEALKNAELAEARYSLAVADYLNSYYGRLAAARLIERGRRLPERRLVSHSVDDSGPIDSGLVGETARLALPSSPPPNAAVVRDLLELGLFDQALDELRYAQRVWGDSPAIQATVAWISLQQGRLQTGGSQQFTLLRGSITAMRRAYPQFMASGGEELPAPLLKVIYPLAYWDLIQNYAARYELDPYLVAALIAQESTFVPDIRSSANAVGLTQLLPSTARWVARTLNLRYSPRLLTDPEANIHIGLAYLAEKIAEFGELHLALASYNAGERAVRQWIAERPGLDREEFIDDIPYPQTRNYVKRVLGTTEDYRRLYGPQSSRQVATATQ